MEFIPQPSIPYEQSNNNCSAEHVDVPTMSINSEAAFGQLVMSGDMILNVHSSSLRPNHSVNRPPDLGGPPNDLNNGTVSQANGVPSAFPPLNSNGQSVTRQPTDSVNNSSNSHTTSHVTSTHGSAPEISADTPMKVDEASARRLAKRLFNLDGFRRSDVAFHLTRNDQFSRKVNEEYLKHFDFSATNLVEAMRRFFEHFVLLGETQERERVLHHFSDRYLQCNPASMHSVYRSQDACHTLTCAIMLLNTDLHGQNVGKRMTLADFMENLSGLNEEQDFPRELLKTCYSSIKAQRLTWARDEESEEPISPQRADNVLMAGAVLPQQNSTPVTSSFLSVPQNDCVETKRGSLQKKHCYELDLKPVSQSHCCAQPGCLSTGKRGWKNHYVVLQGMAMYLLKSPKYTINDSSTKVILLHHCLAQVARNYRKRPFVFVLRTADWSEYLFSTSDTTELESWINEVNAVAAEFSAEPLAAGVGSQRKFHRPLLPSSYSKFTLQEQCTSHEQKVEELRSSIAEEEENRPAKGSSDLSISNYTQKLKYLKFELQRYIVYASLLGHKLNKDGCEVPQPPRTNQSFSDVESVMSLDTLGSNSDLTNVPRSTISPATFSHLPDIHLYDSDEREVFV